MGQPDDRLEQYVQPDPDLPLPSYAMSDSNGMGMDCDDDVQLERWRVSNGREEDDWFGETPGTAVAE